MRLGTPRTSSAPSATIAACASSTGAVPSQRAEPAASMPTPCEANCAMVRPVTARITSRPATCESRLSRAGFEKALSAPIAVAQAITIAIERRPPPIASPSASEGSAASPCSSVRSWRGSRRSATAPPTSSRNRLGSMLAICTAPVHSALARSSPTTSQGVITCWSPMPPNHVAAEARYQP